MAALPMGEMATLPSEKAFLFTDAEPVKEKDDLPKTQVLRRIVTKSRILILLALFIQFFIDGFLIARAFEAPIFKNADNEKAIFYLVCGASMTFLYGFMILYTSIEQDFCRLKVGCSITPSHYLPMIVICAIVLLIWGYEGNHGDHGWGSNPHPSLYVSGIILLFVTVAAWVHVAVVGFRVPKARKAVYSVSITRVIPYRRY